MFLAWFEIVIIFKMKCKNLVQNLTYLEIIFIKKWLTQNMWYIEETIVNIINNNNNMVKIFFVWKKI
jgi:hypothetical protein